MKKLTSLLLAALMILSAICVVTGAEDVKYNHIRLVPKGMTGSDKPEDFQLYVFAYDERDVLVDITDKVTAEWDFYVPLLEFGVTSHLDLTRNNEIKPDFKLTRWDIAYQEDTEVGFYNIKNLDTSKSSVYLSGDNFHGCYGAAVKARIKSNVLDMANLTVDGAVEYSVTGDTLNATVDFSCGKELGTIYVTQNEIGHYYLIDSEIGLLNEELVALYGDNWYYELSDAEAFGGYSSDTVFNCDADVLYSSYSFCIFSYYDSNWTPNSDNVVFCLGDGEVTFLYQTSDKSGFMKFTRAGYVPTVTVGDVNEDGAVNGKDVSAMLKSLAGWKLGTFSSDAADYNGDGKFNNKDVSVLLKHLAGWN